MYNDLCYAVASIKVHGYDDMINASLILRIIGYFHDCISHYIRFVDDPCILNLGS